MSDLVQSVFLDVPVNICQPCIEGAGGECHTPGCMFFICPAPTAEQAERFKNQMTMGRTGGVPEAYAERDAALAEVVRLQSRIEELEDEVTDARYAAMGDDL